MSTPKRQGNVPAEVFSPATDDANHRIASALARRERALAVRHEEHESDVMALVDGHELFGRLTSKMGDNMLDVRRRLEAKAETEEELDALRPLAASYVQVSIESHQARGRRMLG